MPSDDASLSQLRKGVLPFCVLALLVDDERYGFELVQLLGSVDGLVTTEGTMYPLLSRLRKDGLVETSWRESDAGPPRRYYRATTEGRLALEHFTADWDRFNRSVHAILTQGADL